MLEMKYVELVKDYPMLKSWWEARKFPAANPEFLPPTGVLILSKGVPTCAGFLFKSDANAAIMGNLVSNPEVPAPERHLALDALIATLTSLARLDGFKMVCCSTNLLPLQGRFKSHGFVQTDDGVANFGRIF